MRFSSIIFDMDGVIVDSEPLHMQIEQQLFTAVGAQVSHQHHLTYSGAGTQAMWIDIAQQFNLDLNIPLLVEQKDSLMVNEVLHGNAISLFPNVRETITELASKGYRVGLASSSPKQLMMAVLERFKLTHLFSTIVTGSDVSATKPSPEIYLKAAQQLNTHTNSCLAIEDSRNGITAALAAGITCLHFCPPSAETPFSIDGVTQIKAIEGVWEWV